MSMILCSKCQEPKDSDDDPEGFYVIGFEFCCEDCRNFYDLESDPTAKARSEQLEAAYDNMNNDDEDFDEPETDDGGSNPADDDLSDQAKFIRDAFKDEGEKP